MLAGVIKLQRGGETVLQGIEMKWVDLSVQAVITGTDKLMELIDLELY